MKADSSLRVWMLEVVDTAVMLVAFMVLIGSIWAYSWIQVWGS